MASLGNVGRGIDLKKVGGLGAIQAFPGLQFVRFIDGIPLRRVSQSNIEGDPTPSLRIIGPHRYRFLWPVSAGTRTITIRTKYSVDVAGYRPTLVVLANADIGISSDSEEEAASGSGWVVIGPITVMPSLAGVLECELRVDFLHETNQVTYWDTIEVT